MKDKSIFTIYCATMVVNRVLSTLVCSNFQDRDQITISISSEREVLSFGKAPLGGHGHPEVNIFPPKVIPTLKDIVSIACGEEHSLFLDSSGNVYTAGCNGNGQLGFVKKKKKLSFAKSHQPRYTHEIHKVDIPTIKQISCGSKFNICVSEDGCVYSFGDNNAGQLGLDNVNTQFFPKKIESLNDVDFVECGSSFVICKTLNNEIFCWGNNFFGQFGNGTKTNKPSPLKTVGWPDDVVDIKCGANHTLVLTLNQEVYSCGSNIDGQLGREIDDKSPAHVLRKIESLAEVSRIECGNKHSMCIDTYHNLYIFGGNSFGQLGLGDTENRKDSIKHPSLLNVIDISKGGFSTFVKTSENEIYAFGKNTCTQLGLQTEEENQLTPIRVFLDNENIWYSNNILKSKSARK